MPLLSGKEAIHKDVDPWAEVLNEERIQFERRITRLDRLEELYWRRYEREQRRLQNPPQRAPLYFHIVYSFYEIAKYLLN